MTARRTAGMRGGSEKLESGPFRRRRFAPYVLFVSWTFILGSPPLPGADEFSKVSHHSVRMFSFGTLTVDTRVGDVRIEGWDEPRLDVEAEKVVLAKSAQAAEPMFRQLQIQLKGADKHVFLRTVYPSRRPWRPFRGETKRWVHYRIRMPFDANLVLKCVDGDVYIKGITGQQKIDVNYGDVEVNVPSTDSLRSVQARTILGYVQSDLHGEDEAGLNKKVLFWNSHGTQVIIVKVRMGGVYIYSED
jgi:hypothetical protein